MSGSEPQRRSVPTVVLLFRESVQSASICLDAERAWCDIARGATVEDGDDGPGAEFIVGGDVACLPGEAAVEELTSEERTSVGVEMVRKMSATSARSNKQYPHLCLNPVYSN